MSKKKFVIACPQCGKYIEADAGFFAKKKIPCTCGHVIDVRAERMASVKCSECGNNVVYDQSKGAEACCPACKTAISVTKRSSRTNSTPASIALIADASFLPRRVLIGTPVPFVAPKSM